jgi:predicted ribosome quality control (RQC) complex YloA/Tae2 family protein
MSLRPVELELLAAELNRELDGGVIQKVHAPTTTRVYFEVRVPGRSVTVLICSDPNAARVSVVPERPSNPPTPPAWQAVLRREALGAKLEDIEALPSRRTLVFHLSRKGEDGALIQRNLVLEVSSAPGVVLLTEKGRVLAQSIPVREGLRLGSTWTPLEEAPVKEQPSRLQSDFEQLRLSRGAELLFATLEQKTWADARRAPLAAKLKRLARTVEKVRDEADRTEQANRLRREGELLTHNLFALKRGMKSVALTEYAEDGSMNELTIALDPKRTPKEEVEWRFHQYRRLLRGAEFAKTRLATLELEAEALRAQLAALDTTPAEAPALPERKAPKQDQKLPPYREYRGRDARIWVGRGAVHNDSLTFHVARPFHVWFHARGVPGAHVVVPLEKNASLSAEALLDAAHLALHHSDAKGEPRGEVSYTEVKFVRRGGAPGAVTFTREKTINLRVDPERLKRLLASTGE